MSSINKMRRILPLLVAMLSAPVLAQQDLSGVPPQIPVTAQELASDLGKRLDVLQGLLDALRDARGEPLRQQGMERHWAEMQDYMAASLKVAIHEEPGDAGGAGCRATGGGTWKKLSFPGQLRSDDYLRDMQAQMGHMRSNLIAIHAVRDVEALDAALRTHWRSNYEALQTQRGLSWMFESWTPGAPGDQTLPEPDSKGAMLTQAYCSICHAIPHARLHTVAEWVPVLATMDRHIALSDGGIPVCVQLPSTQEFDLIREYFARHAR